MKKPIDAIPMKAMAALTDYHWPGNVRELENFVERSVILSHGAELQIPLAELRGRLNLPATVSPSASSAGIATLEHAEREHIIRALREAEWIVGGPNGAANRLGMKRTTLQSRIKKLGIARPN
jgi:formate hydrogenlyase transcriptional activator